MIAETIILRILGMVVVGTAKELLFSSIKNNETSAPLGVNIEDLNLPDPDRFEGDEKKVVKYLHAIQAWKKWSENWWSERNSTSLDADDHRANLEAFEKAKERYPYPQLKDFESTK